MVSCTTCWLRLSGAALVPRGFSKSRGLGAVKQLGRVDFKRCSNALKDQNRRVSHSSLHTAYITAVEPTIGGKVLLCNLARCAETPYIPTNPRANVHWQKDITP